MINNFSSKKAQDIFDATLSRYSREINVDLHPKIRRLFDQIDIVRNVEELRSPPGNRLQRLSGNLQDFWSLRINSQYRIIFRWYKGIAFDVDIIDYH